MPNTAVDVNSWAVSACYPRSTFYPLSDGPSTWNHRITKAGFPLCSRCPSRSQAGLCLCTLRRISIPSEPTFARLRYSLGGDRPSQTAHQKLSPRTIQYGGLEIKLWKGGISRAAPDPPEGILLSLPPILRIHNLTPTSSCSKGSGVFLSCRG